MKPTHWWDVQTWDIENITGHVEQVPGALAWLGEQMARAQRQVNDLTDRVKQLEAQKFLEAKSMSLTKTSVVKGGTKDTTYTPSDEVAKFMARADNEVCTAQAALNAAIEARDKIRGYLEAINAKVALLTPIVGIHRDELRHNAQK
jgi:hypothetical protein